MDGLIVIAAVILNPRARKRRAAAAAANATAPLAATEALGIPGATEKGPRDTPSVRLIEDLEQTSGKTETDHSLEGQ